MAIMNERDDCAPLRRIGSGVVHEQQAHEYYLDVLALLDAALKAKGVDADARDAYAHSAFHRATRQFALAAADSHDELNQRAVDAAAAAHSAAARRLHRARVELRTAFEAARTDMREKGGVRSDSTVP